MDRSCSLSRALSKIDWMGEGCLALQEGEEPRGRGGRRETQSCWGDGGGTTKNAKDTKCSGRLCPQTLLFGLCLAGLGERQREKTKGGRTKGKDKGGKTKGEDKGRRQRREDKGGRTKEGGQRGEDKGGRTKEGGQREGGQRGPLGARTARPPDNARRRKGAEAQWGAWLSKPPAHEEANEWREYASPAGLEGRRDACGPGWSAPIQAAILFRHINHVRPDSRRSLRRKAFRISESHRTLEASGNSPCPSPGDSAVWALLDGG